MNVANPTRVVDLEALQARVGLRLGARLEQHAETLPADIRERLRVGRENAVQRARQTRLARRASGVVQSASGSLAIGPQDSWWLRVASAAPLVLLVLGLMLIQQWHERQRIHAAADVDAALLADDLPPAAYRDAGFVEFLRQREP
jgi:hypothetical protein